VFVASREDRFRETTRSSVREADSERPFEEAGKSLRGGLGRIGATEPERRVGPHRGRVGKVDAEPRAHHPQRHRTRERGHHVASTRRDQPVDELRDDAIDVVGEVGHRARGTPTLHGPAHTRVGGRIVLDERGADAGVFHRHPLHAETGAKRGVVAQNGANDVVARRDENAALGHFDQIG
jgi:hypothetical protein